MGWLGPAGQFCFFIKLAEVIHMESFMGKLHWSWNAQDDFNHRSNSSMGVARGTWNFLSFPSSCSFSSFRGLAWVYMGTESQKAQDRHYWILQDPGLELTKYHFLHILLVKSGEIILIQGDGKRDMQSQKGEDLLAIFLEIICHFFPWRQGEDLR